MEEIKEVTHGKKCIIYGAGIYGSIAYKVLKEMNAQIMFFCDRKLCGGEKYGIKIYEPKILKDYSNADIYIATKNYYSEVRENLEMLGCGNIHDIYGLLKAAEDLDTLFSSHELDIIHQKEKYLQTVKMTESAKGIRIVHVEAVVTECCNLHCRDCADMMQFYKNPSNIDIGQITDSLDRLLQLAEYIGELRILGGEPFLNRQIGRLIEKYSKHKKIGIVTVYTNGTIIPPENLLKTLAENNTEVHISDYGILKKEQESFIRVLEQYKISYFVRTYDSWNDFGNMTDRHYDEKKLNSLFSNCTSSFCLTLHRGRLFGCPRAAHSDFLGTVKAKDNDYVDLTENEPEMKKSEEKLRNLVRRKYWMEACRYCDGTDGRTIEPAIQKEQGR